MEKMTDQYDCEELRNEPLLSQAIERLKNYEATGGSLRISSAAKNWPELPAQCSV